MTTHITKTWFDGKNIVTQEIPVGEVYKREWQGLTKGEINSALSKYQNWYDFAAHLENILKEKNQ